MAKPDYRVRFSDFVKAGVLTAGTGFALSQENYDFFIGWISGIGIYLFLVTMLALADWESRTRGRRPEDMPMPGPSQLLATPENSMAGVTMLGPIAAPPPAAAPPALPPLDGIPEPADVDFPPLGDDNPFGEEPIEQ